MKAEIRRNGILEITSETELEAFALGEWVEKNLSSDDNMNVIINPDNLRFDWSFSSKSCEG